MIETTEISCKKCRTGYLNTCRYRYQKLSALKPRMYSANHLKTQRPFISRGGFSADHQIIELPYENPVCVCPTCFIQDVNPQIPAEEAHAVFQKPEIYELHSLMDVDCQICPSYTRCMTVATVV